MDIHNPNTLKENAQRALNRGREPKKVIAWYTGITVGMALAVSLLNLWLNNQITSTGGLGNMGTRAIYSTAQMVLPILQSFASMCLNLGYLAAILRIARGQYADQTDLKVGFRKFFLLLRMVLLKASLFFVICIAAFQISYLIFMMTPWAEPLMELLYPIAASGSMIIDEATLAEATSLMSPMLIMFGVLYLALCIPYLFRFRMAEYIVLDNASMGAMAALRESRKIMRGNFRNLFQVDLSFWWYYLLTALTQALVYDDLLLSLMGISLPFSPLVSELIFYGIYLAATFAITYCLRNSVETTYVMAYECIHEKPKDSGVVLGNIFDM